MRAGERGQAWRLRKREFGAMNTADDRFVVEHVNGEVRSREKERACKAVQPPADDDYIRLHLPSDYHKTHVLT
jgi:hypothetical protein